MESTLSEPSPRVGHTLHTDAGRRGLTPLFHTGTTPYGTPYGRATASFASRSHGRA